MSTLSRRAAAMAVTLLVLAIVAILVLRLAGAPVAQGPLATATLSPTGSPIPSTEPSPTATPVEDQAQVLAGIEAQVRQLRGLPAPDINPPDLITRAQLADEVRAIVAESWTPDELRRANLTLQAMGLLTPDQDIAVLTERLLAGQVIGFYEYMARRMVVVTDAGLDPTALVTYAHEYTHALQDAAFDSGRQLDALTDDDAIGAYQALVEGDATILMFQWALANLTADELGGVAGTPLPDTTGIPDWMIQQLQWPYLAGAAFLSAVSGLTFLPDGGGSWSAVDDVYANPPATTEQVLHPEKYVAGEVPAEVEPIDVASVLGEGWENLEPNTLGEAMISIWLAELGPATDAETAAAGWGGDRMVVAAGPGGAWAMAWVIDWDTPADAGEFADAWLQLTLAGGTTTSLAQPTDDRIVIVRASTPQAATALADSLDG